MRSKLPKILDMIRGLIAIPSISSCSTQLDQGNLAIIELLASWLEAIGCAVQIQPIGNRPDKVNLIATLGSGSGGLVLSGHTDTVPYDEGRWKHDPFAGVVEDNRLYGLGSADMKSFLALAIEAAQHFDSSDLRQPLIILATADEESSMSGAKALVEAGRPLGRYALIGEPTNLRPARMHKGVMMEAIRLEGQSGHSSNPALGVNALEGMYLVLGEILKWRAQLQEHYHNLLFEVAVPTLNLGHIHGGDSPNRICASCELHIDLRPLPGMPIAALRAELRQRVAQVLSDSSLKLAFISLFEGIEALETPASSALVRAAEELTCHQAGAVAFGTEGPYLNTLGMDTIILGPGSIDQAHQPDEYLPLASLNPTLDLLNKLIHRFCIQPQ